MGTVRKKSENASIDTFSTYSNNLLNLENRMARVNLDTSPAYLNGQSAALTFDPIEITDSTQYSSFLNPKILPNIESGTTESAGTDADTSETKNEQGATVFQNITPGTMAFTFTGMSTSKAAFAFFTTGNTTPELNLDSLTDTQDAFGKGTTQKLKAFGASAFKQFVRPIGIINGTGDRMIFFPKASWAVSFTGAPSNAGYLGFSVTVTALEVNTQYLKTMMVLELDNSGVGA